MAPLREVHCSFCEQTFFSNAQDKCPLCGKTGGLTDFRSVSTLSTEQSNPSSSYGPQPNSDFSMKDGIQSLAFSYQIIKACVGILKLGGTGIFLIVLGIWLLADPAFRSDSAHINFSDIFPGIGAILAGVALFGLLAFLLIRRS